MSQRRRLCVFCGSHSGSHPAYLAAAKRLGALMVERDVGLVYGGGGTGMMGALADAVLEAGGEAIGVMPRDLFRKESRHQGLTETIAVESMHARKALMYEMAVGFVVLPGGFGTLDELFETLTWQQIGLHHKPIALVDAAGFFQPLRAMVNSVIEQGFASLCCAEGIVVHSDVEHVLDHALSTVKCEHS